MLEALPVNSAVYKECMVLADEFIESYIGKRRTIRIDTISRPYFGRIVPD
jgi:hypothetical protein